MENGRSTFIKHRFLAVGSFGWVVIGLVLGWVVSAYSDRIWLFYKLAKVPTALCFPQNRTCAHSRKYKITKQNWAIFWNNYCVHKEVLTFIYFLYKCPKIRLHYTLLRPSTESPRTDCTRVHSSKNTYREITYNNRANILCGQKYVLKREHSRSDSIKHLNTWSLPLY